MRQWDDVLATAARLGHGRRLALYPGAPAPGTGGSGAHQLEAGHTGCVAGARKKGGPDSGPNPCDRGRPGSKHHLLTDGNGLPLVVALTAANVHDGQLLETMLDAVQPIASPRGRPRKRPDKLHADKAYSSKKNRAACRRRHIAPRIARPGIESKERLGRHRWKVERTFAWLHRYRRLLIRWERRPDLHLGFLQLACCLIAFHFVVGTFC